jgi:steroid 5-alpha reductase family enzyme
MWWGVGAFCVLNMPSMSYLITGAILNNLLFLFVSVPLADGRQSKKEGFEQYKKETRMFLPIKRFR